MVQQKDKLMNKEELEKMVPEYLAILDKATPETEEQAKEEGLAWLREKFADRPADMLSFASLVAIALEERGADQAEEVKKDADAGESELVRAEESEGTDA